MQISEGHYLLCKVCESNVKNITGFSVLDQSPNRWVPPSSNVKGFDKCKFFLLFHHSHNWQIIFFFSQQFSSNNLASFFLNVFLQNQCFYVWETNLFGGILGFF